MCYRPPVIYDYNHPKKHPAIIEKTEDYDNERRKSYKYPENPEILIERPRYTFNSFSFLKIRINLHQWRSTNITKYPF